MAATAIFLMVLNTDPPCTALYSGTFTLPSILPVFSKVPSGLTSTTTAFPSFTISITSCGSTTENSSELLNVICIAGHTVYSSPVFVFMVVMPPSCHSLRGNPRLSSLTQRKFALSYQKPGSSFTLFFLLLLLFLDSGSAWGGLNKWEDLGPPRRSFPGREKREAPIPLPHTRAKISDSPGSTSDSHVTCL